MTKRTKMDVGDVSALVMQSKNSSLGGDNSSTLTTQRTQALEYYNGEMNDMRVAPGRSSATSSDVMEVVEGIMPTLMDIFCGGDSVVRFEPHGPEDVDAAEQETDYVNHVFMHKNDGFVVLYTFIKDALLSKLGVVKAWWEEVETVERQTFRNQPDDVFFVHAMDERYEIVDHKMEEDEYGAPDQAESSDPLVPQGLPGVGMGLPPALPNDPMAGASPMALQAGAPQLGGPLGGDAQMPPLPQGAEATGPRTLHSYVLVRKRKKCYAKVAPVPPEEFLIDRNARNFRDSGYCCHVTHPYRKDLVEQGYDVAEIKGLTAWAGSYEAQAVARNTVSEEDSSGNTSNWANQQVEVLEHYIVMDYELNNRAGLYKVVTSETGEVLTFKGKPAISALDEVPFAGMTPIIVTHRVFGKSLADLVLDIQRIKTALLRGLLDNVYLANNNRYEVAEQTSTKDTIQDLLSNRVGGFIRVKTPGTVIPIQNNPIGPFAFPMLEYVDGNREFRTGVSKMGQGLDADVLQNQTAKAVGTAFNAAQAKTKLIARIFAETGIKDLFKLLHSILRKNQDQADTVRLRNKWVKVDPKTWDLREDMTPNVGLGSGTRQEQIQSLLVLMQQQKEAIAVPQLNLVKPKHLYNSAKQLVLLADMKSPELYFNDPESEPPPPAPEDPKVTELKLKHQLEQESRTQENALEQAKMERQTQIEALQAKADAAVEAAKTQSEIALKEREFQLNAMLKVFEARMEQQMKAMEMRFDVAKENLQIASAARQADQQFMHRERDHAQAAQHAQAAGEGAEAAKAPATGDSDLKALLEGLVNAQSTPKEDNSGAMMEMMRQLIAQNSSIAQLLAAENEVVRDPEGRVSGVRRKMSKSD